VILLAPGSIIILVILPCGIDPYDPVVCHLESVADCSDGKLEDSMGIYSCSMSTCCSSIDLLSKFEKSTWGLGWRLDNCCGVPPPPF
jgi:hypothetical protein